MLILAQCRLDMTITIVHTKCDINLCYGFWFDSPKKEWMVAIDYSKTGGDSATCSIGWLLRYGWGFIPGIRGIKFVRD